MHRPTVSAPTSDVGDPSFSGPIEVLMLASAFAHGRQWTLLVSESQLPPGATSSTEPGPHQASASVSVSASDTLCAVRR